MAGQLRAVVVGAGWAGEGHAKAFQWAGVEVAAICARQPDVVRQVADRLGVTGASVDWRRTLREVQPEIVSIATPATLRAEVIEVAISMHSHIFCDKPLALTGDQAGCCYDLVRQSGVKHAYAATQRYDPSVAWLAELVRDGAIGPLRQITASARGGLPPIWSWALLPAEGGGELNNVLAHHLGILATLVGGEPLRVMGDLRTAERQLMVLPETHDIRNVIALLRSLPSEQLAALPRRPGEIETGCSALFRFSSEGGEIPVSYVSGPGVAAPGEVAGYRLYGDTGTLQAQPATGLFDFQVSRVRKVGETPESLPLPQSLLDDLPNLGNDELNKWAALVREFVADIRGAAHRPYLTFRDGWRYQLAIDAIRAGRGWSGLPA